MCRRVESYVCLFARKPSELSFIIPFASAMSEPMYVTTEVHSFWMQFISAMGLYEAGVHGAAAGFRVRASTSMLVLVQIPANPRPASGIAVSTVSRVCRKINSVRRNTALPQVSTEIIVPASRFK